MNSPLGSCPPTVLRRVDVQVEVGVVEKKKCLSVNVRRNSIRKAMGTTALNTLVVSANQLDELRGILLPSALLVSETGCLGS